MADQAVRELPRIAFVYGDPALAEHVREAIAGCVEIAYATPVEGFDAARLADARVAAALVNVDNADWLDDIQARLDAAGVPAVFNDPDISRQLEGWDRARWLRHLTAKLSGSADFDPPRPEPSSSMPEQVASGDALVQEPEAGAAPATGDPTQPAAAVVERPLSAQEIETMTADFANAAAADTPATTPDGGFLDVDTEALSAMIDAHLAKSEASAEAGANEAWAIADTMQASAAHASRASMDVQSDVGIPGGHASATGAPAATTVAGDPGADLQDVMPPLDDWQLLDPDSGSMPAVTVDEHKPAEPALPDAFAGLELVPMEAIVPLMPKTDPIERWLDDTDTKVKTRQKAKAKRDGEKA